MRLGNINSSSRENNLNLVRLMAAISVTFSHSFSLITGQPSQFLGTNTSYFGSVPVAIFFALSGFLITQSFITNPNWKSFVEARCLRIFPGLFFANLVTIVAVGLFVKAQGLLLLFDLNNIGYLISATFFKVYHYSNAFPTLPYTSANGSLWTLPVEFRMYFFVLLLGLTGALYRRYLTAIILFVLAGAAFFEVSFIGEHIYPLLFDFSGFGFAYVNLFVCFSMGILFNLYKEKIPISIPLGMVALVAAFLFGNSYPKYMAIAYVCYVVGYHPKLYIPKLNFKDDLSYGIYVLSFPIQQTLLYTKSVSTPTGLFISTMLIVTPLAWISWRMVEKPALRFKGYFRRKVETP